MVTAPVLSVALAAKLSTLLVLRVKSLSTAGSSGSAETVTANAAVEARDTEARNGAGLVVLGDRRRGQRQGHTGCRVDQTHRDLVSD